MKVQSESETWRKRWRGQAGALWSVQYVEGRSTSNVKGHVAGEMSKNSRRKTAQRISPKSESQKSMVTIRMLLDHGIVRIGSALDKSRFLSFAWIITD